MVNLKEATDYMVANGYITMDQKTHQYRLTKRFHQALIALESGHRVKDVPVRQLPVESALTVVPVVSEDWVSRYKQFIIDARIPARGESKSGDLYALNKYSEPGMKAFRKAIEGGARYELLVMSTALYYKSAVRLKVAIGRYMDEGLWRSDYDSLEAAGQSNTVTKHIKEQIDDGQFTSHRLG